MKIVKTLYIFYTYWKTESIEYFWVVGYILSHWFSKSSIKGKFQTLFFYEFRKYAFGIFILNKTELWFHYGEGEKTTGSKYLTYFNRDLFYFSSSASVIKFYTPSSETSINFKEYRFYTGSLNCLTRLLKKWNENSNAICSIFIASRTACRRIQTA